MSKKAVVYTRISSTTQESWGWLGSQETSCRQYCERKGYEVIEVFQDVFSWGELNRPWIKAMFNFIDDYNRKNTEKISVFVTHSINRIARDYKVHLELTTELLMRKVNYETVDMTFERTPMGKYMEWMMALNAEFFRTENKERVISRQEARLLDGYRPFDHPTGYRTTYALGGWKLLIADEPNASIIKEALEGYANDIFNSIDEVAKFLQQKGLNLYRIRNKKREWKYNYVHKSLAWRMLKQILYTGYIAYNKVTFDKNWLIKKEWNIPLRKGRHEWIIDLSTYYKIQEKLNGKRPYEKETKAINENFPLRWYIECDCCNLKFSSGLSRSKNRKQVPYYQYNKGCIHKGKSINANKLHTDFDNLIQDSQINDEFLNFMKLVIASEYEQRKIDKKQNKQSFEKEVKSIDNQVNNLVNSLASSSSNLARTRIEQKIDELEMRKVNINEQMSEDNSEELSSKVIEIACSIIEDPYYIWKDGNISQKQSLLNILFRKKIPVNKMTGTFWTLPFSSFYLFSSNISKDKFQHLEVTRLELVSKSHA